MHKLNIKVLKISNRKRFLNIEIEWKYKGITR